MKVLEEKDGGLAHAPSAAEAADHVEELPLPRLRTERRRLPLWIWYAEEVEHEREPLGERLVQQQHAPGDLVPSCSRRVLLGDAEVTALELEDRKQRYRLAVGDSIVRVNDRAADMDFFRQLGALRAGDTLHLVVRRAEGERELHFRVRSRKEVEFRLKDVDNITPQQRARRAAWLKGESQLSGETRP